MMAFAGTIHDPITFTTDPAAVVSVVWVLNYDDLLPEIDPTGEEEPVPERVLTSRFQTAGMLLEHRLRREYPNCTSVSIRDGGWGGAMAQISPRADTADDSVYEPFFDEVIRWSEEACAVAQRQHPMPTS